MGLIATMTALILGLVTASAKAAFDAQDSAIHASAADTPAARSHARQYGPQTKPVRDELREAIRVRVESAWGGDRSPAETAAAAGGKSLADIILQGILELSPQNDAQRWQQSQALSTASEVLKRAGSRSREPAARCRRRSWW